MEIEERYQENLSFVESLLESTMVLGLHRIEKVLALFDNPQDKLCIVHVAGTNGKGSTTMMLTSIYKEAGYQVGTFISPYVVEFRERIQCNGCFIEKEIFCNLVEKIRKKLEETNLTLTYFEMVTVIAFLYYEYKKCDIVFLEVGLGGRLDATNVILKPLVCVITKIDYDHTHLLGNTLTKITQEKCGIIKKDCPVVSCCNQEEEVIIQIQKACHERNCVLYVPDREELKIIKDDVFNMIIQYKGICYEIGLHGTYQIQNTLTVLMVVDLLNKLGFTCKEKQVQVGIKKVRFAGRFEIISKSPTIILDGAHNPSGTNVLLESVKKVKKTPKIAIVSILKSKDRDTMIQQFAPHFDQLIIVPIHNKRATPMKELEKQVQRYHSNYEIVEDYQEALEKAKEFSGDDGAIFVFGSLYLISEMRKILE